MKRKLLILCMLAISGLAFAQGVTTSAMNRTWPWSRKKYERLIIICTMTSMRHKFQKATSRVFYLLKGTHPPVPKGEVQSVIGFNVLMMVVMIKPGVQPSAKPAFSEPGRIQFISQMAIYIIDEHNKDKCHQCIPVQGQNKNYDYNDTGFHESFQRMKGKCSPWSWVGWFVMNFME